jgi:16S rRNA (cytosine967-C5)-methyltransferase
VLRRLGQIDALIGECLNTPLAPRAAVIHDVLRLGIAQLLFLRTPPHAAVATSVDLAHSRGFLSHKGLVNAVLRRLSVEGQGRVETPGRRPASTRPNGSGGPGPAPMARTGRARSPPRI